MLSGHTHGGQVRLPGLAARVPPDMTGFPLVDGWGLFDRARLYVNRGVGMTGIPLRFRCRPEVALITLRRGDGPPVTRPDLAERAFRKAKRVAQAVYRRVA
jgi:predicted MPP superfamily phosphohydrolase